MVTSPPLLYGLPGWGFSADILTPIAPQLIGLDYLTLAPSCLDTLAKKVADNILPSSYLLGWSLGGLLALRIASLFPEKVQKLILVASQPYFLSDRQWQGINPQTANNFLKGFKKDREKQISDFLHLVYFPSKNGLKKPLLSQYFVKNSTHHLFPLLQLLFTTDLRESYKTLSLPILHLINKRDAVIQQKEEDLKKLNPSITVIHLKQGGHAGFLDAPHFYQDIIQDFLYP